MDLVEYKKTLKQPLRNATLLFLVKGENILLALKKRGFGVGRWNGVGGKPEEGETIEETAIRECQEEIGVTPLNMECVAVLDFYFENNPLWNQCVTVYFAEDWEGTPTETDEMKPEWYRKDNLPFDNMWPDDRIWLTPVIKGSKTNASFLFGDNDMVLDFTIEEMKSFKK